MTVNNMERGLSMIRGAGEDTMLRCSSCMHWRVSFCQGWIAAARGTNNASAAPPIPCISGQHCSPAPPDNNQCLRLGELTTTSSTYWYASAMDDSSRPMDSVKLSAFSGSLSVFWLLRRSTASKRVGTSHAQCRPDPAAQTADAQTHSSCTMHHCCRVQSG